MRATKWAALIVLLQLLLSVQGGSVVVTSVSGESAFDETLTQAPLVMVKFFHPGCPHCQAIKQMYDDVAHAFMPESATLRFAQVDISLKQNNALTETHSPDGVPTLKLFKRGVLLSTFTGSRDEKSLSTWLRQHVHVYTSPIIHQLNDDASLAKFLSKAGDGPVVLTLAPAPPHADADMRIERYATAARDAPGPTVLFGRVPHPSLLVPDRKRYESIANVYAAAPYAAAVRNASNFKTEAQWWFPGVIGGEPLHAFVASATLPRDGNAVLTSYNAPALSSCARSILYGFGSGSSPGTKTMGVIRKLARVGGDDVVVVYVHDKNFEALRKHVGLGNIEGDERTRTRKTKYVLYRTANRLSERRVYQGEDDEDDIVRWLRRFLIEHGRFPMARGLAGVVNVVSKKQFEEILEHDGRIVLFLVCGEQCDEERAIVKEAAQMLKADARAVVVVEYNGDESTRINGEVVNGKKPYVGIVLPGAKPMEVRPYRALEQVRHAIVSVSDDPDDVLVNDTERFGVVTINHVGFLLIVLGLALTIQNHALMRWRRKSGRRGESLLDSTKNV